MTEIWLIRHGQSEANAGMPTADASSSPLTQWGQSQAAAVANSLPSPPALIASSSFTRARQTADRLQSRFPDCPLVEWPIQEYTFLPADAYRGTRDSDRQDAVDDYWELADPRLRLGTGAESYKRFIKRIRAVHQIISTHTDRPIAVVSHRRFIAGLIWTFMKNDFRISSRRMKKFHAFDQALAIKNGAIVPVYFTANGSAVGRISTSHLDGLLANCGENAKD